MRKRQAWLTAAVMSIALPYLASPAPPLQGASAPLPAAPDSAAGSFAESVDVAVVNVDVVVRDKSGKLVDGLRREDFALFEDGKTVEVTNFSLSRPAPTAAQAPPDVYPPGPPAATAAAGAESAPTRERLNLVVFVDNANMLPFDRNRVLKQLRGFLQQTLASEDRVLLLTHDLGLHVRHAFREDPRSLDSAIDKLEKESAGGLSTVLETRQAMEQIRDLGCGNFDAAKSLARAHAESVLARVKATYANLHHLLESLGGLDGRKVLLYVGNGVPNQVGTDVFGFLEEFCSRPLSLERVTTASLLHQVTAAANANRVTFYTLEAVGLRSYASAQNDRPLVSTELNQRIEADRQDSLANLARETGGRAALNGNDFRHDLEAIAADLNGSYSLGFISAHPGDGKVHTIRVELKPPGLRADYRQSYRDRSPAERLEGQLEAALIHGYGANPLAASLKLGTATPAEHGRVLVPAQLRFPFGKLVFLPGGDDARHGRVSILVGVLDGRGGMSPIRREQLPLRIPEADTQRILASQLGHDVKLLLEPGHQRVVFAVRDEVGRVSSCLIQDLDVDKKGVVNVVFVAPPRAR